LFNYTFFLKTNNNINEKYVDKIIELENRINNLISNTDIEEIKSEISAFSEEFVVTDVINLFLNRIVDNGKYYLPFNTGNRITFWDNDKYELSFFFNFPSDESFKGKYLYSYPNDVYMCSISETPVRYSIYEQSYKSIDNIFNGENIIKLKEEGTLIKNKTIFIEKSANLLKLDKKKPLMSLVLTSKRLPSNYCWEYDSQSLLPIRIVLLNTDIARLSVSCKILSQIGNINSKDNLINLCTHEAHIVRWEAVRALMNIDYVAGFNILQNMVNDKHPEIKKATLKSLEILNSN